MKRKIFRHPTAGRLTLHYASLRPDAVADDVIVVLYVPEARSFDVVRRLLSESVE